MIYNEKLAHLSEDSNVRIKEVVEFSGSGRTIFIPLNFTEDRDNIQDGRLNICCSSKTVSTTPKDQDKITNGRLAIVYFLNINRIKMNYDSQCGLTRGQSLFVLVIIVRPCLKKHFNFVVRCFNHLVVHFSKFLASKGRALKWT